MIYVLIVVALFAALGVVLARQGDTSESGGLSDSQADIYSTTVLDSSAQIKQALEQMIYTGTDAVALDFTPPDDANFNIGSSAAKVFHPHGGGVVMPRLPDDARNAVSTDPAPGWYLGRFSNVEWTPGPTQDVLLTAHQISERICARINKKLTGDAMIPQIAGGQINELLIDAAESTAAGNIAFTSAHCAACFGRPALCVQENGANAWSFYSLMTAD